MYVLPSASETVGWVTEWHLAPKQLDVVLMAVKI